MPMAVTPSGITILVKAVLPAKTESPIFFTEEGMMTSAAVPVYLISVPSSEITKSDAVDTAETSSAAAVAIKSLLPADKRKQAASSVPQEESMTIASIVAMTLRNIDEAFFLLL